MIILLPWFLRADMDYYRNQQYKIKNFPYRNSKLDDVIDIECGINELR